LFAEVSHAAFLGFDFVHHDIQRDILLLIFEHVINYTRQFVRRRGDRLRGAEMSFLTPVEASNPGISLTRCQGRQTQ